VAPRIKKHPPPVKVLAFFSKPAENRKRGGTIAGNTRREIEAKTGKKIVALKTQNNLNRQREKD